nr:uncharacterized protein LOC115256836 [Aedes albopictus]XP_029729757.1 uncharacterized protein LOC115267068 [Aedes albopictus]
MSDSIRFEESALPAVMVPIVGLRTMIRELIQKDVGDATASIISRQHVARPIRYVWGAAVGAISAEHAEAQDNHVHSGVPVTTNEGRWKQNRNESLLWRKRSQFQLLWK